MGFEEWMDAVDELGIKEGIFDPPDLRIACSRQYPRRPYRDEDGFFHMAYDSGMTPRQALAEALVEQDCG